MEDAEEPIPGTYSEPIGEVEGPKPGNPNMKPGGKPVNPTGRGGKSGDGGELSRLRKRVAELEEDAATRDAKAQLKVALARVAELEKEVAELRAAKEEVVDDPGDRLSDELIKRCLEDAGREEV